jgi:hypothetical protein
MPRDSFSHEIMVLHVPGFGRVDQLDFGFEIHDVLFIPLNFPLKDGASWDTAFEGRAVTATATVTSNTTAEIRYVGANDDITAVYDAEVGAIVEWTKAGYATYRLVDHGLDYEGVVTVPHEHDVIFINGRMAGVVNFAPLGPGAPVETVSIDPTYQRVSFAIILGAALPQDPGVGYYSEKATAPDGTVYELTLAPPESGLKIGFFSHDSPGGDWQLEHVAAGPGIAFIEGIAYHVFDVSLPDGCLMPAEGEHAHGDASCGSGGEEHEGHDTG